MIHSGTNSAHFHPDCDYECHVVYDNGQCGFTLRFEAGQYGLNRVNTDINAELKSLQTFFSMTNFFPAVS
jgi:hypothetical protein